MRIKKDDWIINVPIAHRGLWGDDVEENTMEAYARAVENGYPVEIDLYETADGKLVSFHDKWLERMTGEKAYVFNKTFEQLSKLKIGRSQERIPLFDEVLSLCEKKVPLLIELKNQPSGTMVEKVVNRLKSYKGEFAVQSFNPFYLMKVKKLAPEFLRGILACENAEGEKPLTKWVVKHMPFNGLIKPDFISYCFTGLPLPERKRKGLPVLAWTVTDRKTHDDLSGKADNIIFEGFIPKK